MLQIGTMLLGQRSRPQSALKLCAKASLTPVYVKPIALSCMVGFENNLAQMVIMIRQCDLYKNHVARSKS